MNPHSHPQFGMTFQFPANLDRAEDRRFGAGAENERATVARGQAEQFAFRFRQLELLRAAHDLLQCLKQVALLGDEHFRVTDDVDEQDMPDLELHVWKMLGRHATSFYPETQARTSRISRRLWISSAKNEGFSLTTLPENSFSLRALCNEDRHVRRAATDRPE